VLGPADSRWGAALEVDSILRTDVGVHRAVLNSRGRIGRRRARLLNTPQKDHAIDRQVLSNAPRFNVACQHRLGFGIDAQLAWVPVVVDPQSGLLERNAVKGHSSFLLKFPFQMLVSSSP
jgi:hypothetical protein